MQVCMGVHSQNQRRCPPRKSKTFDWTFQSLLPQLQAHTQHTSHGSRSGMMSSPTVTACSDNVNPQYHFKSEASYAVSLKSDARRRVFVRGKVPPIAFSVRARYSFVDVLVQAHARRAPGDHWLVTVRGLRTLLANGACHGWSRTALSVGRLASLRPVSSGRKTSIIRIQTHPARPQQWGQERALLVVHRAHVDAERRVVMIFAHVLREAPRALGLGGKDEGRRDELDT